MKDSVKQMLVFSAIANAIGWGFMLVANFAFSEAFQEGALMVVCFGWPILVEIAYIILDLKMKREHTPDYAERFVECFVRCFLWIVVTGVFMFLAIGVGGYGPWHTMEAAERWFESDVIIYAVFGGVLIIGVTFVMIVWFVIRAIYYMFKSK